jgi:hypothetical protein
MDLRSLSSRRLRAAFITVFSAITLLGAACAAAQALPRLNLQVNNVDRTNSCQSPYFRPQFKITNFGSAPARLNQVTIRMYFNALPSAAVEFVNADYAIVFNGNGSITGSYATAYHFEAPPNFPACRESLFTNTLHVARQQHFIAFHDDAMIPPGGYVTVIAQFRRAGGQNPFDVDCDDWTRLIGQNPVQPFEEAPYYSLVQATGGSPGAGYPTHLMCEYNGQLPANGGRDLSEPWGGVDPCTLTQSADCPAGPRR